MPEPLSQEEIGIIRQYMDRDRHAYWMLHQSKSQEDSFGDVPAAVPPMDFRRLYSRGLVMNLLRAGGYALAVKWCGRSATKSVTASEAITWAEAAFKDGDIAGAREWAKRGIEALENPPRRARQNYASGVHASLELATILRKLDMREEEASLRIAIRQQLPDWREWWNIGLPCLIFAVNLGYEEEVQMIFPKLRKVGVDRGEGNWHIENFRALICAKQHIVLWGLIGLAFSGMDRDSLLHTAGLAAAIERDYKLLFRLQACSHNSKMPFLQALAKPIIETNRAADWRMAYQLLQTHELDLPIVSVLDMHQFLANLAPHVPAVDRADLYLEVQKLSRMLLGHGNGSVPLEDARSMLISAAWGGTKPTIVKLLKATTVDLETAKSLLSASIHRGYHLLTESVLAAYPELDNPLAMAWERKMAGLPNDFEQIALAQVSHAIETGSARVIHDMVRDLVDKYKSIDVARAALWRIADSGFLMELSKHSLPSWIAKTGDLLLWHKLLPALKDPASIYGQSFNFWTCLGKRMGH